MIKDLQAYSERVFGHESAFSRAINFSDPVIPIENILGKSPKFRISDWEQTYDKRFPLQRSVEWNKTLKPQPPKRSRNESKLGEGDPPKDLLDFSRLKHAQRKVSSLINIPLWDRAQWKAVFYVFKPDSIPIVGFAFMDATAGKAIFEGWRKKIGERDTEETLRISIVTGIDAEHPYWYTILVGSNMKTLGEPNFSHMVSVYRICQMRAETPRNLEGFLKSFRALGRYLLIPVHMQDEKTVGVPFFELGLEKRELSVRPAWQIGPNDPDSPAIHADDNPIIPEGTSNEKVLELLKRKRQADKKKR